MGFRYPITTATDIDTRTTIGTPGMYTAESVDGTGNTTMTVALTDGFAIDADAGLFRTTSVNPRSQASSQSGGLAVKGGSYAGITAPDLDLNVELVNAGVWQRAARLANADVLDLAGAKLTGVGGIDDSGWITQTALGSGYTIGSDGAHYRKVAGLVFFQLDARGTATGLITNYPAGFRPSITVPFIGEWGNAVAAELKLTPDGNLTAGIRSASAGFIVAGCFPAG